MKNNIGIRENVKTTTHQLIVGILLLTATADCFAAEAHDKALQTQESDLIIASL